MRFLSLTALILPFLIGVGIKGVSAMELIGHRGASEYVPENTKESILAAFSEGAKGAECDIQVTKDNQIVLLHDRNLKRTTGVDLDIDKVNFEEIKDLDAGSFMPSWKNKGVRIPLLKDILKIVPKDRILFIEIKKGHPGLPQLLASEIAHFFQENKSLITFDNIAFISFDLDYIDEMKKVLPQVKSFYITCYNYPENQVTDTSELQQIIKRAKKNRINGIDFEFGPMINPQFVNIVKLEKLETIVWVSDADDLPKNVETCKKSGIDYFTTDDPKKMESYK